MTTNELAALQASCMAPVLEQPAVARSLYHHPSEICEIPLFLKEELLFVRLQLHAHQRDGLQLFAYAVPPARLT